MNNDKYQYNNERGKRYISVLGVEGLENGLMRVELLGALQGKLGASGLILQGV